MKTYTIKRLLTYNYAFITIIPFFLILTLTLLLVLPQETKEFSNQNQQFSLILDGKIESFLKEQVYEINKVLAIDLRNRDVQQLIDKIVDDSDSLNAVYMLDSSGFITKCGISFKHDDSMHQDLEGVDMSQTPAFKTVTKEKKAVWSDVFMSVVSGRPAIAYVLPLYHGYLVGEVSLQKLSEFLKLITPDDGSLVMITDRDGQVIADHDGTYSARRMNISNLELMRQRSAQQVNGSLIFEGTEYIGSVSPIATIGWYSLLATPRNATLAESYKTTSIILTGLILALLLAAVSAEMLMKKLSKQFGMLTDFANQIAKSKQDIEWQGSNIAEFEHVAATMLDMADILHNREGAIMEGLDQIRLDRLRFECLFELSSMVDQPEKEIIDYALDAAVKITSSKIGYIYMVNEDETVLTLHAWSKDVMAACSIPSPPASYPVAETGLWGEAVRQRQAVITNDYEVPNTLKKGYPEGHVRIKRHLNLPIFYNGKIAMLAGVGNKEASYEEEDIHQLQLLLDATWLMIEKKRSDSLLTESKARSRQIFQQNDDGMVFLKLPLLRPIDANPAIFRMLGIAQQDLSRFSLRRVIIKSDLTRVLTAIRTGKPDQIFDRISCRRSDGSLLMVSLKISQLTMNNENLLFWSFRDISEKIRIEEATKATQAKLIQANKMTSIGLMVSSIAHEVNNPNQCVNMNAFILKRVWQEIEPLLEQSHGNSPDFKLDGVPFAEMKQTLPAMIASISDSSYKINNYINRLLNFAKNNTDNMDAVVDLNRAVENATSILWYQLRSSTERFSTVLSSRQPATRGNAQQIEQVIINVISNALQALPSKSAAVTVRTDLDELTGDAVISCRDEGIGMDSTTMTKLAEPFFSTRQENGGTGLGVYIATNIIKEHGGSIIYDSEPGRGTIVTIRLPGATQTIAPSAKEH